MQRLNQYARGARGGPRPGLRHHVMHPPRAAAATPVVLHVIDSLRTGGAEVLLTALVRELAAERLARNIVAAASADADPVLLASLERDAEALLLVDQRRIVDPRLPRALVRVIRSARVDVVHSHLSTANVSSRFAALLTRRPHVTTVHTQPGPTAEDTRAHAAMDGWSSHLSARIVCPSREIADGVRDTYRVAERRLRVIPNAPAAATPGAGFERDALRAELLAGAPGPLVACVARLQPEKGIADLIAAAGVVARAVPGLRVVIAGDGPQAAPLAELASAEGGLVRLLGPRDDVGDVLAASDAFCLPSHHEGVPLSMLEGMDAGLPCVVTAVGGIPDVATDGETALLVPPRAPEALAAALTRVLTDAPLASRLGAAGARLVREHYSLASVARRYADLYRELAGR